MIQEFSTVTHEIISLIEIWEDKLKGLPNAHVIQNIKVEKLGNEWIAYTDQKVTLKEMVLYYLKHFELHLGEIDQLIKI